MSKKATNTIKLVRATHWPHRSGFTPGGRRVTRQHAGMRVDAVFEDGSTRVLAKWGLSEDPRRISQKLAEAEATYRSAIGKSWEEVQSSPHLFDPRTSTVRSTTPRWFRCGCGAAVKVSKLAWRKFSSGEKIDVFCEFCSFTETVCPPDTSIGAG